MRIPHPPLLPHLIYRSCGKLDRKTGHRLQDAAEEVEPVAAGGAAAEAEVQAAGETAVDLGGPRQLYRVAEAQQRTASLLQGEGTSVAAEGWPGGEAAEAPRAKAAVARLSGEGREALRLM